MTPSQLHFPLLHVASPLHAGDPLQVHIPEVHVLPVPEHIGPPPHVQLPPTQISLLPEQMTPKQRRLVSGKCLYFIFSRI